MSGRSCGKKRRVPSSTQAAKEYLLNLITTQGLMGLLALIENTQTHFPDVSEATVEELIAQLCQESQMKIINPQASRQEQLICLPT